MKKLLALLAVLITITGCSEKQATGPDSAPDVHDEPSIIPVNVDIADTGILPDMLYNTYYLSPEEQVHSYMQNNSIRKFLNMWLDDYMDEQVSAEWDYGTLAPVQILDHSFNSIAKQDMELYTCTFTTDDGRCGYIIVSYTGDGPAIHKYSLHETTPYLYDLKANSEQIAQALADTDIDLTTATASRVEWIDTEKNRGDRIILFIDGKDDKYVCYLGDDDFTLEKQ